MKDIKKRICNFLIKYKKYLLIILVSIMIILGILITNIRTNKNIEIDNNKIETNEDVTKYVINVDGAVNYPKEITIYEEKYLFEIINECGGFLKNANIDNINLIDIIDSDTSITIDYLDEELDNTIYLIDMANSNDFVYAYFGRKNGKVNIYKLDNGVIIKELEWIIGEDITSIILNSSDTITSDIYLYSDINKICINTASKEELMTISGIGEGIANKIIEYRKNNGFFKTIEDITKVSGISTKMFEKIKDLICVN